MGLAAFDVPCCWLSRNLFERSLRRIRARHYSYYVENNVPLALQFYGQHNEHRHYQLCLPAPMAILGERERRIFPVLWACTGEARIACWLDDLTLNIN